MRRQSTKDIDEWIKDERIVYPSRVINQEIDNYYFQKMQKFPLKRGKESFFL
ncbi:putative chaperone protein [Escherichia coli DEC8B]|nr:putative chaperone protein [Escherichia coli DEC8B]